MYTFFSGSLARIPIVCSYVVFNYSSQIHPDEERSVALNVGNLMRSEKVCHKAIAFCQSYPISGGVDPYKGFIR
jgi:hypothetical protein